MEAKHEYFENQPKYDGSPYLKDPKTPKESTVAEEIAAECEEDLQEEVKSKRKKMTIAETKLGVTMVISHEDCTSLGFKNSTMLTGEAIVEIRKKLGLKSREEKRKSKKEN